MKTKLIVLTFLVVGVVAAQVSIGIRIGAPPAPRVMRVQPRSPGSEYAWIAGYWYPVGHKYKWHEGYWTRPPYGGARWIEPRYESNQYYEGRWNGDRGDFNHDHRWDRGRDHNRDYNRGQERR